MFELAAFHQSQVVAFVQSTLPFQVMSGACAPSTRMLFRSTTYGFGVSAVLISVNGEPLVMFRKNVLL